MYIKPDFDAATSNALKPSPLTLEQSNATKAFRV